VGKHAQKHKIHTDSHAQALARPQILTINGKYEHYDETNNCNCGHLLAQIHNVVKSVEVVLSTCWNPIWTLVSTATRICGESGLCLQSSVWHLHLALVPVRKQRAEHFTTGDSLASRSCNERSLTACCKAMCWFKTASSPLDKA